MVLLTPGPCMTSDPVRQAAAMPDMNHRDPAYLDMVREVKERLLSVYPETRTGWQAFLIGGSGTAAVEAMVSSCIREGPALVIENGFYSERMHRLLEPHQLPALRAQFPWTEEVDYEAVEQRIAEERPEAVLMTHNETTTGRLNDLAAVGRACRPGATLLVDAMSSFGADQIDFDRVDAVAASANKCLHGIPGVSFVLVRADLAKEIAGYPRRTFYLSLPMYAGEDPPLTPPVPALAAFRQALRELPMGGAAERRAAYSAKVMRVRRGLDAMEMPSLVPEHQSSVALTTARLPSGWSSEEWAHANRKAGYAIYECKGPLREKYFQTSVMGEVEDSHLEGWLSFVRQTRARQPM